MKFSSETKQPRKKRKALYNSPLHQRQKQVAAHLSKELRAKEKKRSIAVHKGDKIRVVRGVFKKKEGKIVEVSLKKRKIFVEGCVAKKQGGKEVFASIDASNVLIIELEKRGKVK